MDKKLLLVLLSIIMLITFSSCKKEEEARKPITPDSFEMVAESVEYETKDVTENFKDNKKVLKAMVARVKNKYQIEYYTLEDAEFAKKMYDKNKKNFESQKETKDKAEVKETENYSEYKLSTRGKYKMLSKIDNTLMYADVDEQYKDNVINFAKQLGYLK